MGKRRLQSEVGLEGLNLATASTEQRCWGVLKERRTILKLHARGGVLCKLGQPVR